MLLYYWVGECKKATREEMFTTLNRQLISAVTGSQTLLVAESKGLKLTCRYSFATQACTPVSNLSKEEMVTVGIPDHLLMTRLFESLVADRWYLE